MKALSLIPQRFAVLTAALVSSLALALGGCMSAPQSSAPMGTTQALACGTGFVYSANEGEDSISRIDLATRRVTTLQLPVTPHSVQISREASAQAAKSGALCKQRCLNRSTRKLTV